MWIDKQIGTYLVLLPGLWGIAAAAPFGFDILMMSKFTIGAVLAWSAGCVINDYWDWDIDKHVERTRLWPITSGEISPN